MPIARLSRKWYDTFGDDLTSELVDCLNAVDAGYRAELRDLFAAHFSRFEERLERRTAELEARLERGLKEQARWLFAAWATLLLSIIGLWMRG